jgi:hypothetical protein
VCGHVDGCGDAAAQGAGQEGLQEAQGGLQGGSRRSREVQRVG